jgi:hypothetical protein
MGRQKSRRKRRRTWSKEVIVATICKLHGSRKSISSHDTQVRRPTLYRAGCKYFGSWKQTIEAAGIDYITVRKKGSYRRWSKTSVARAIRERWRKKLSINYTAVSREDAGLRWAAVRYFGKKGWVKALRCAGINPGKLPDPRRIWTKEKLKNEILSRHKLGLFVNSTSMRTLNSTVHKLFGDRSWSKVIRFSGLSSKIQLKRRNWWTRKRIVYQILRLQKAGIRLSSAEMQESRNRLYMAAVYHFDSWSQAVDAAGIDYRLHCRMWSTKAWVRKLSSSDLTQIKKRVQRLVK